MGSPEKPIDVEMGDMSEEAKLNPTIEKSDEVKENGKVEEKRFTGLKKEDLLKISNQPKWVRARWALFIAFWIIWIAMLVGAILIVVNAPRCKPEPKTQWYQDTVVYELNAKEYAGGFEGAKEHFPYVGANLHARTVSLTGAHDPSDLKALNGANESSFEKFVDTVHAEKEKSYVVVDLVVDSLPASGCTDASDQSCEYFTWKDGNDAQSEWRYVQSRNQSYKLADNDRALIDYSKTKSLTYILDVIRAWFSRGIDGIKIRDVSKLENIDSNVFVETLWNDPAFQNETGGPKRALYVYSSIPSALNNPVQLDANDTNTLHSPVFLTAALTQYVNQNDSGSAIQNTIENWREQSRSISGYVVSPVDQDLAATRVGGFAAALNIFSMALPGVPFVRSGDELGALLPVFTWSGGDARDSVPLNGSQEIMKQTKDLIVSRVAGIQAQPSLRYDTRDNDTTLAFLDVGQKDVIAFTRKWDKKQAVLVVSNLSPNNHTVNLMVENGLRSDNGFADKAKVVATSNPKLITDDGIKLDRVKMDSGTTLVLVAK